MNKTKLEKCEFCNSELEWFMQSDNFYAIYNIAPVLTGHSLIIPKWHVESVMDLSEEELSEMVIFSRKCIKVLIKVFSADSFNWTIQEGENSGQTIKHLHLHLIPRKKGDLAHPGDWYPKLTRQFKHGIIDSKRRHRLTKEEIRIIVSHIKKIANDI